MPELVDLLCISFEDLCKKGLPSQEAFLVYFSLGKIILYGTPFQLHLSVLGWADLKRADRRQ